MPGETGRPTVYTEELAADICAWLAEGKSLRSFVDENDHSPARSTICLWIVTNERFSDQYRRAREAAGYAHADDIVDIVDEVRSQALEPHAAKVMMDGKKWAAERMAPRAHAPRQQISGPDEKPIQQEVGLDVSKLSTDALAEIVAAADAAKPG